MKTTQTPGPWRVLLYGGTRIDVTDSSRLEQPVHCNTVAICYRDASDLGFRFTPRHEQAEANARLIAAAPELLDACIRITTWLDKLAGIAEEAAKDKRFITLSEAHAADSKNFRSTSADIKKVIAKAEGAQ